MSKILILANDESTIYNFRRELLQRLVQEKYKVIVCFPRGSKTQNIINIGCEFVDIEVNRNGKNPLEDFKLLLRYRAILKVYKPDVVLTYTIKPNVYGSIACRLEKVPYVNNVTGLGSIFAKQSSLQNVLLILQKFAYKQSQCVFFQNAYNYNYFQYKEVVANNIRMIPGSGVNLLLHSLEEYPAQNEPIKFITVSRIRRDKGFHELFEAARRIKSKYHDVEFHVVGWYEDQAYEKIVKPLVKENIIIYHGAKPQEEVHDFIKKSHCLVLPSYHEGMANVLLEGAACGRPILASNIPGCKEAFDEGISGLGFQVQDASDLEKKMIQFIELPYVEKIKMGQAGRRKVEKEFDRNIVINAYIEEIYKITSNNVEEKRYESV